MIKYNLETEEQIKEFMRIVHLYPALIIDVSFGKYTVDGKYFLGVQSLMGHEVIVNAIGKDETVEMFYEDLRKVISNG